MRDELDTSPETPETAGEGSNPGRLNAPGAGPYRDDLALRPSVPPMTVHDLAVPAARQGEPAWLKPLGEILRFKLGFSTTALDQARQQQKEKGGRIGDILVANKVCTEEDVLRSLAEQLDLVFLERIEIGQIDITLVNKVPIQYARSARVLPLRRDGAEVVVATPDPLDLFALHDLKIILGGEPTPALCTQQTLLDAINGAYDRVARDAGSAMEKLEEETDEGLDLERDLEQTKDLIDLDDEAPIIRLVNSILSQAVRERASDIHIEPMERDIVVRFRIDGVLYEVIRPPKRLQAAISSRIKIMGGLKIDEKRLPQDGRIRVKIAGKDIDLRLSTLPTSHGERIVMRILDKTSVQLDLFKLGFNEDKLTRINTLITKSHGIILVTGPTGSGKTTTLYAALSTINRPDINIITVEDPVEYQLQGIGQIPVNSKIGMTFASALRAILRQDPDVILIGETRDLETAEIAIQASLTGHLVFTTLHTNDAPSAVTRLVDMGVEPFLVSSSLIGILAQRLVRRLCVECKEPYTPTKADLAEVGLDASMLKDGIVYREKGCAACLNTGFAGRECIAELMSVDEEMREMILKSAHAGALRAVARKRGMLTLREDGARKVVLGATSIAEVLRVTQDDSAG
jgi:general secretion pathway protein E